jgi:hypothetical protein
VTRSAVSATGHRRGSRFDPLALTAWALMANTATTSVLGVAFWGTASRLYPPAELGEDAALISAMILLSAVSQMNLSMGIARLLPQVAHRRWRPVLGAYAATAVVAAALTLVFSHVAPRVSAGFAFLSDDHGLVLTLVAAVVLWNVFALQDAVLTAARWAPVIPFENALFGLLKIALMVWLARGLHGHGAFLGWVLAMALMLVPMNALIFWKILPSRRDDEVAQPATALPLAKRDRVARYLMTDYLAALLSQGSTALLPMLVVGVLGRADNAYFYIAFLIAAAVGALSHSLSLSLLVEGAHDESSVALYARRSIARYVKVVAPAVAVLILAAPLLLAPFGREYVANATTLLRLLLAGTVAQAVTTIYLGVERVRARVGRVLAVEAATVALVSVGALLGMRAYGLAGMGVAWLSAQVTVAVLVAPWLWGVVGGKAMTAAQLARRTSPRSASPKSRPFPSGADLLDVGAVVVTAALLVVTGVGVSGAPSLVLGLVFVTFVPGWAVLDHVPLARGAARVALAVALSLSLTTTAAVSSLWLDVWHPRALLDVTGALCLVAVTWHLAQPGGRRRAIRESAPVPTVVA